jgi:hypothetical protein
MSRHRIGFTESHGRPELPIWPGHAREPWARSLIGAAILFIIVITLVML